MSLSAFFPREKLSTLRRPRIQLSSRIFYCTLILGMALRVATLFSVASIIDSDRAIVYLMAKHFSQGQFTTLFWGQNYGGTFLQASAGAAMVFFGRHIEVLEIVSALTFCGAALVVRSIATHAFGQLAGDLAGTIFWFPGAFLLRLSLSDPGFYGPTLLFGLLAMWLALTGTARSGYLRWWFVGLLAGLAFWQSSVGGALAFPAVIWLFWRNRSKRHYTASLIGAVVGASPWLFAVLTNGFSMVRPKGDGRVNLHSFVTFFTQVTPYAMRPLSSLPPTAVHTLLHDPVQQCVGALSFSLLVILVAIAIRERNEWVTVLVVSTILSIILIVVASGLLLTLASARYSLYLLPLVSVALAWIFAKFRPIGYLAMGVIPIITSCLLLPGTGYFTMDTSNRYGSGTGQVEAYLGKHKVAAAYGDYWLAYNLSAKTQEEITMAALEPRRYTPYEGNAEGKVPMAIVVYVDRNNDRILARTTSLPKHKRQVVGGYAIYIFDKWFNPYQNRRFNWDHSGGLGAVL